MYRFQIQGKILEAESNIGISGLFVKAYDKDLLFDDLLGTAFTKSGGAFVIRYELRDFKDLFETKPDIYLDVYSPDGEDCLYSTKCNVRMDAGSLEEFEVLVPKENLGQYAPNQRMTFRDDQGKIREDFDVGESICLHAEGLLPNTHYESRLYGIGGQKPIVSRLMTNRKGEIEPSVLWANLGLIDPDTSEIRSLQEAEKKLAGQAIRIELWRNGVKALESKTQVADFFKRPIIYPADKEGKLKNGFEIGEQGLILSLNRLPFNGNARIFLIPSQRNWFISECFRAFRLASGEIAVIDIELNGEDNQIVELVSADQLLPGNYDFLIRHVRYGYEDLEIRHVLPEDLINRLTTGLVIRPAIMNLQPQTVNQQPISGRRLPGSPYFRHTNVFQLGEDIYGALDPSAISANHSGKMVAFHIIRHKTLAEWDADMSLTHLPELGGNGAEVITSVQAGCINSNITLLWSNADLTGEFDIVADFGNNATSAADFAADHVLNPGLDIVDGYSKVGFRILPDPGLDQSFEYFGKFSYRCEAEDFPATTNLTDRRGDITFTLSSRKEGVVYFPADEPNITSPEDLCSRQPTYPLVIMLHGNRDENCSPTSFAGFDYLLEHLAKNGFIAVSIYQPYGWQANARAELLLKHLTLLIGDDTNPGIFCDRVSKIGLLGHSRGGEAVIRAMHLNDQYQIDAVVAIAPTDSNYRDREGEWLQGTDLLILYGSMDGDVAGGRDYDIYSNQPMYPMRTGFSIYDNVDNRASKSMAYIYGASHARFNSHWSDFDLNHDLGFITPEDDPKLIQRSTHEAVAKAYVAAFFRQHLKGETIWNGIFKGEWIPASIDQAEGDEVSIYMQYQTHPGWNLVIDNFENGSDWRISTIGQSLSGDSVEDNNSLVVNPQEAALMNLDTNGLSPDQSSFETYSPHNSRGLKIIWEGREGHLNFIIPSFYRDVSNYRVISLRVAQSFSDSTLNNPQGRNNPLYDKSFYVTLTDQDGKLRSLRANLYGEIPFPHERGWRPATKSALCTIRIPLEAFLLNVSFENRIDLTQIRSVKLDFNAFPQGNIMVDSLAFSDVINPFIVRPPSPSQISQG